MRFLNWNNFEKSASAEEQKFIRNVIDDLTKQNQEEKFIENFVEKYGYPDWDMTRWFKNGDEVVAQVPVLHDNDCETQAVILCVKHNDELNFALFERDNFDKYADNVEPTPTADKIKDLFIIFDFQKFGESNYLPNGKIVSDRDNTSNLKGGYVEKVTTCYHTVTIVDGEEVKHSIVCDTDYNWVHVFDNGSGGGGSGGEWYNPTGGGTPSNLNPLKPEDKIKKALCDSYNGIIMIDSLKNNYKNFTLYQEQFVISLANLAALHQLNLPMQSLKNDLVNFSTHSNLYSKYSKLYNHEKYTADWTETINSSPNNNDALISSEIGSSGFQLKFYPEKNGDYNALGLVKKGWIEHTIEGALEYLEHFFIEKGFEDDFLYDMHLYNALNYMEGYCND